MTSLLTSGNLSLPDRMCSTNNSFERLQKSRRGNIDALKLLRSSHPGSS